MQVNKCTIWSQSAKLKNENNQSDVVTQKQINQIKRDYSKPEQSVACCITPHPVHKFMVIVVFFKIMINNATIMCCEKYIIAIII